MIGKHGRDGLCDEAMTIQASRKPLRLGTRGSLLARTQSQLVADELMRRHPGLAVELVVISTTGDRVQDRPLTEIGGKGLFVKELEMGLLDGRIDLAVHSYKDMPVTMPLVDEAGLIIAAVPPREDPRDVAVMLDPAKGVLPAGARIGTSSLRRQCQILSAAPDATILPLRGNIDTRLRKLRAGEYDVIILAMAGLKRAGLYDPSFMAPTDLTPAAGQGALAVQCRRSDHATFELLHVLNDPMTTTCVNAERKVVQLLDGDCHSPIAAWAVIVDGRMTLDTAVGTRDGVPPIIRASAEAPLERWEQAVADVIARLLASGARNLLSGDS